QFIEDKFNELLYEPSGEFDNFCRMSYSDFEFLLQKKSPMISKHDTDFREAIPAKFRLAITLRFLASGDSCKSLHYLFKVSVSMISIIIREVCRALNEILKDLVKNYVDESKSSKAFNKAMFIMLVSRGAGLMIWSDMIRIDDEGAVDVDGAGAIGVGIEVCVFGEGKKLWLL
ncbi:Uncharacterized protein OBRU01_24925, partial [Operophtera brumata]